MWRVDFIVMICHLIYINNPVKVLMLTVSCHIDI